ncbi:SDR family oxidoreductase [Cyclobacterium qasimii]|uniref:UDP-glucose 4-epimerase n=2 Tax=Cyclobacterium qasimii TaxID=1350429 RepID=S7V7U8_9BACT|nr:SDR family oxidoreductase [Cyclobacterium qasimii]EPR66320.1 UDP-glucose 4-epimerase [Cyclobacterium qasimii M12-11B]GEO20736.1 epimerase [Cyclobacterium qasimii]
MPYEIKEQKVLVTGGAGFIGSNLIDSLLLNDNTVVCLDNFSTGNIGNLEDAKKNSNFTLLEGDIRDRETCMKAVAGCEYVFHQAALGSVPRSIADPITSTEVNILGFVNLLFAAKEAGVKRFVYAASSSTYGDHQALPKVEHVIGNSLSPYAITKYVDELFAKNFSDIYGIETVGLRYFNVFGRRQDPDGAYAAVIPRFVSNLIQHQSPYINGDGSNSRDFTYIDNVIQANLLAAAVPSIVFKERLKEYQSSTAGVPEVIKEAAISEVFNVAFGARTSLNELAVAIKKGLTPYDKAISQVEFQYGPNRAGDVAHSMASIHKGKMVLGYNPQYSFKAGLNEACAWYWEKMK